MCVSIPMLSFFYSILMFMKAKPNLRILLSILISLFLAQAFEYIFQLELLKYVQIACSLIHQFTLLFKLSPFLVTIDFTLISFFPIYLSHTLFSFYYHICHCHDCHYINAYLYFLSFSLFLIF